ncbi:MAG TPA: hypothetical protein PKM50_09860 [Methanoregula sp.]|nr:hypothetical protein [Methanoregula sp.]
MVFKELQEAVRVTGRTPVLFIPGIVAGLLGALVWVLYNLYGSFFTTRLVIIFALVMVLFIAGTFCIIKKNDGGAGTLVTDGARYYFRVLLPWLVIFFILMLVFFVVMTLMMIFSGGVVDYATAGVCALFFMIPTVVMVFFCDTAAVFSDLRVFASLRQSILVVSRNTWKVMGFFVTCCLLAFVNFFVFAVIWEALLFNKLEPLTRFNETQLATFTPDQLVSMIGPDGMWVTAVMIFFGFVFLVPLLITYKATFYQSLTGSGAAPIQQMTGEYDSKGRWYKY